MRNKNLVRVLLALVFVVVLALGITSCEGFPGLGNACEHEWLDATCTTPKTCSLCGATDGEALGHNYGAWETKTEATCSTEGELASVCANCNGERVETLAATGHNERTLVKVDAVPATHTANGNCEYYSCVDCDKLFADLTAAEELTAEQVVLLSGGHVRAEKVEAVPATHTSNGTAEYWYCADCDAKFEGRAPEAAELSDEDIIVQSAGHVRAEKHNAIPATHTTDGVVEYYYCSVCDANFFGREYNADEVLEGQFAIPATGHIRATKYGAVQATHTANGNIEYWHCDTCNANFTGRAPEAELIPAGEEIVLSLGHEFAEKVAAGTAPTHTTPGATADCFYCAVCDKYYDGRAYDAKELVYDDVLLPALGHVGAVKTEATQATHYSNGNWEYWFCADCNGYFDSDKADADQFASLEETVITATGHMKASKTEAVAPTHTANGNIEYWYCDTCNANFTDRTGEGELIPAGEEIVQSLGHERADFVAKGTAATHNSNGAYEDYYYCAVCDKYFDGIAFDAKELVKEEVVILAMGHINATKIDTVPATHTQNGTMEYWYCETCDAKFEGRAPEAAELTDEEIVILAMGHDRSEKILAGTAPTHTAAGANVDCYYCATCDAYFEGRAPEAAEIAAEDILPALGHVGAMFVPGIAATHSQNGTIEYWYCETCDANFLGTEADAEQISNKDIIIPAMGHIRATKYGAVQATHTSNGNIEYWYCETCDANFTGRAPEAELIPAGQEIVQSLGHERAEKIEVTPATHTAHGFSVEHFYCPVCEARFDGTAMDAKQLTYEEVIALSLGHERAEHTPAVASTHTSNGNIEYYYCSVCDANFTDDAFDGELIPEGEEIILSAGHIRAEKVEAVPATHTQNGTCEYWYCADCDANFESRVAEAKELTEEEMVILAMGHERAEKVEAKAPTLSEPGNIEYWYCADCNANFNGRAAEAKQLTDEDIYIPETCKHTYENIENDAALVSIATVLNGSVYYKSCSVEGCGKLSTETFTLDDVIAGYEFDQDALPTGVTMSGFATGGSVPETGRWARVISETVADAVNYYLNVGKISGSTHNIKFQSSALDQAKYTYAFAIRWNSASDLRKDNVPIIVKFTGFKAPGSTNDYAHQPVYVDGVWSYGSANINAGEWYALTYEFVLNEEGTGYDCVLYVNGVEALAFTLNGTIIPVVTYETRYNSATEGQSDMNFDLDKISITTEHNHKASNVVAMKFLKTAASAESKNVYYQSCAGCGGVFDTTFEYGDVKTWTVGSTPTLSAGAVPGAAATAPATDANANGIGDGIYTIVKTETITNVKNEQVEITYLSFNDDHYANSGNFKLDAQTRVEGKKALCQ